MSTFSIASRYTKSLLQLAIEKNLLSDLQADMLLFDQVCDTNPALYPLLKSPVITHSQKHTILKEIFRHKVSHLMLRFLYLIIQKNRAAILPIITKAFLAQYNCHKGIKNAVVTTTVPLSKHMLQRFKAIVKTITPCNDVLFTQQLEQKLLGGYLLEVDDKKLDASLQTKLHTLKQYCTKLAC